MESRRRPQHHPHAISRIERGTKPDDTLTHHYRTWLHNHQPTT